MSAGIDTVRDGLGKGNLWLFCDISGWHWYHNVHRNTFLQCMPERNATKFKIPVKQQMEHVPWKDAALPKINNLGISEYIHLGFTFSRKIEVETNDIKRSEFQFQHLLCVADHEQRVILQPLIYQDNNFAFWIKQQRAPYASWASPALELVFSSACTINNEKLKSKAPEKTKLEDEKSRMSWIAQAAEKFHGLMMTNTKYMTDELEKMASWKELADPLTRKEQVIKAASKLRSAIGK